MNDVLTYRNSRDEMCDWLEDESKNDILSVIEFINEGDEYPYQLPVSGTKADLIDALRDVPKRVLWDSIDEIFEDYDDEENEIEEKEEEPKLRSRSSSRTSEEFNLIRPNDINIHSFDLSLLNLDQEPEKLLKRIENFYTLRNRDLGIHNLTVLLSGPSGAGKTHLIKFLSKKLNRSVMFLSASSFLSKYVGETEQNTKKIFDYAEKTDAIVFIDEIEGLLQSRAGADHSWEMTQVNELLVRLESFKGVCIGATNLYKTLDPAFYRRFTLKVEFSFMKKEVRWAYVQNKFKEIISISSSSIAEDHLKKINHLTPGDIESVYRRLVLDGVKYPSSEIVREIEKEVSLKKHVFQKKINLN